MEQGGPVRGGCREHGCRGAGGAEGQTFNLQLLPPEPSSLQAGVEAPVPPRASLLQEGV